MSTQSQSTVSEITLYIEEEQVARDANPAFYYGHLKRREKVKFSRGDDVSGGFIDLGDPSPFDRSGRQDLPDEGLELHIQETLGEFDLSFTQGLEDNRLYRVVVTHDSAVSQHESIEFTFHKKHTVLKPTFENDSLIVNVENRSVETVEFEVDTTNEASNLNAKFVLEHGKSIPLIFQKKTTETTARFRNLEKITQTRNPTTPNPSNATRSSVDDVGQSGGTAHVEVVIEADETRSDV